MAGGPFIGAKYLARGLVLEHLVGAGLPVHRHLHQVTARAQSGYVKLRCGGSHPAVQHALAKKVVERHALDVVHALKVEHARGRVRVIAEPGYRIVRNPKVRTVYHDVGNSARVQNENIIGLARKGKDRRRGARNALVGVLWHQDKVGLRGVLVRCGVEGHRAGTARGNDHRVGSPVARGNEIVPNTVGPRKVAALWIAVLSGSRGHSNRRIRVGEPYLVNVDRVHDHIVGRRRRHTGNVHREVAGSTPKAVDQYVELRVPISGEGNLALKAARVVVTHNAGKRGTGSGIDRDLGVKIGAITEGKGNITCKAACVVKGVPYPRRGNRRTANRRT